MTASSSSSSSSAKAVEAPLRTVVYEDREYEVVKEGLAEILNPRPSLAAVVRGGSGGGGQKGTSTSTSTSTNSNSGSGLGSTQAVFYNPIQQFNRDLSVLAIRVFAEDYALVRKKGERKAQSRGAKSRRSRGDGAVVDGSVSAGVRMIGDGPSGEGEGEGEGGEAGGHLGIVGQSDGDAVSRKRVRSSQADGEDERPSKAPRISEDDQEPAEVGESGPVTDTNGITAKVAGDVGSVATATEIPIDSCAKEPTVMENAPKGPRAIEDPPFRILDALSATGLRALRYAKEVPHVTSITANDLSPSAVASIRLNVKHNNVGTTVHPITGNALTHMYYVGSDANPKQPNGKHGKYHVVDLDPYGTASPFLDAAIQALYDGGLLCVTCTDSGIFASTGYMEKTFSTYGGLPIKGPQSHEGGIRLLLHAIATNAARHSVAIEPLLSLSIDFYMRVFVRLRKSPNEVKLLAGKTMVVYNCDEGCGAWTTQHMARTQVRENSKGESIYKFSLAQAPLVNSTCEHCGIKTHLAGPMWGGPIHNPYFIQQMLDTLPSLDRSTYGTIPRIEGMLYTARDETLLANADPAKLDAKKADTSIDPEDASTSPATIPRLPPTLIDHHPFFFFPSSLAKVLHCVSPSFAAMRSAFLKLNYRVTRSHTRPGSMRTDAPWTVIWEVMREWARQKAPVREGAVRERTAGWKIMQNARSNVKLKEVKRDLADLVERGGDIAEVKKGLESLLWRIEKQGEQEAEKSSGGEDDTIETTSIAENGRSAASKDPASTHDLDIVFNEALGREPEYKKRLVRYQVNPRANWGPMSRARGEV